MKLTFKKGRIESAPKKYVRITLTDEPKEARRFVRDKGIETLEIGVGKPEEMNARKFIILCRSIVRAAKANKIKKIAVQLDTFKKFYAPQRAAENFEMANFDFSLFKTKQKGGWDAVEEILLYGKSLPSIERETKKGQAV